jgi:hypothetical protein
MVRVMVSNAIFNNISVISWWLVLLVEETGVSGENHRRMTDNIMAIKRKNEAKDRQYNGHK